MRERSMSAGRGVNESNGDTIVIASLHADHLHGYQLESLTARNAVQMSQVLECSAKILPPRMRELAEAMVH
jgi:hypothetical protein